MSAAEPPRIVAAIAGEHQRAAMLHAGDQFAFCVGAALQAEWPVRLRLIGLDEPEIPPGLVLVTAPSDPAAGTPLPQLQAQWAARIARWRAAGHERILVCNRFRGADGRAGAERIRRLNRMVVDLSRALGVEVVDVDRLFALVGGRRIAAGPQGAEAAAARLAGHAIAEAILAGDLADALDPAVQARAAAIHGPGRDVEALAARVLGEAA